MADDTSATRNSVDERDAASYLGDYTPHALRAWRRLGKGPAFVRIGRSVRYLISDLDAFLRLHRIEPKPRGRE